MPLSTFLSRLCFFPIVACLFACGPIGPNHQTPAIALPQTYTHQGVSWKHHSERSPSTAEAWWKAYNDATLDKLVQQALSQNQQLAAAHARLKQARELSNQAKAAYFPAISITPSLDRTKTRFRGISANSNINESFEIPADFDYELDAWGKIRRQIEAAKHNEEASAEALNALKLSISGEVAQTYWALRATDAERTILTKTLEIRNHALKILNKKHNSGAISGLDLARAQTEVASAEATRLRLDQTRADLSNSLAILLGSPQTIPIQEHPELPEPPSLPTTLPSDLLRQRPDIRSAEHRVAAANANIGVALSAFYPSFRIRASGGFDAAEATSLINASSLVWSLGANALTPITGQKLLRARHRASIDAHEATCADYKQSVIIAVREVENTLQGSEILQRRQLAQNQALQAAQKASNLSLKRFQAGLVGFLDVIDTERSRLDHERAANAIRAERLAASVSLYKAIGGQW